MKKSMILIALIGLSFKGFSQQIAASGPIAENTSRELIPNGGNGGGPRFHTFQGELSISLAMDNDIVFDYCAQRMRYPFTVVVKSTSTVVRSSPYPILLNFQFGQAPIMVYKAGTPPVLANKIAVIDMWTIGIDTVRGYFLMGVPGNIELPRGGSPFTVNIASQFSQGLDVYQVQDNPRNNSATVSVQTNVHVPVTPSPFDQLTGITSVIEDTRTSIYGYLRQNRITGLTESLNQGQSAFYLVLIDPIPQPFYMEKAGCFTRTGEPYYFLKNGMNQYLRYDNGSFTFDGMPSRNNANHYYWVFKEAALQDEQGRPGRYIYNVGAGIDSSLRVNGRNLIVMDRHDDDDDYQVFYIH